MKILMSAFACSPGEGGESGVGWNWATEAARQGHRVVVLTQTVGKVAIDAEIAAGRVPQNLSFDYLMPRWLDWLLETGLKIIPEDTTWQLVHLLWQVVALSHVRRCYKAEDFDIIHHVTYAGVRHPTLLGHTPIPLVLGPIGGGDRIPFRLRKHMNWTAWLWELARDIHNGLLRFDPITRGACAKARVVYASTPRSNDVLPKRQPHKILVYPQFGCRPKAFPVQPKRRPDEPLRLVFAGRLLYLKGIALGLHAIARARRRGVDVRLTMAGSGPNELEWRRLSGQLGIEDIIDWRGWVPHDQMDDLYRGHHAMLFPSLRESAPSVVLESLSNGAPVICLQLGGQAQVVTNDCGRVIPVKEKSEEQCIVGLAGAIEEFARSPELCRQLSSGALSRAQEFYWPRRVAWLYADVLSRLELEPRVAREEYYTQRNAVGKLT